MVDKRNVRRDAERKAREALGGDLVSTVGDLAMATADRVDAVQAVDEARARGEELVSAARQQAEKLVASAQAELESIDDQYGKSYAAARNAGWTTTQLKSFGYPRPAGRKTGGHEAAEHHISGAGRTAEAESPANSAEVQEPVVAVPAAS